MKVDKSLPKYQATGFSNNPPQSLWHPQNLEGWGRLKQENKDSGFNGFVGWVNATISDSFSLDRVNQRAYPGMKQNFKFGDACKNENDRFRQCWTQ
jgi:hypothetical protein